MMKGGDRRSNGYDMRKMKSHGQLPYCPSVWISWDEEEEEEEEIGGWSCARGVGLNEEAGWG